MYFNIIKFVLFSKIFLIRGDYLGEVNDFD